MRIAVHSAAPVGTEMASPAIRAYEIARELARTYDVSVVAPGASSADGAMLVRAPTRMRELTRLLAGFDVVIAQKLPPATTAALARRTRLIFDLYTPVLPEGLAALAGRGADPTSMLLLRAEALVQQFALTSAAGFICTTDRQRDFWLGMLGLAGRLDPAVVRRDPLMRSLIDVVPFGLPTEPPAASRPALKGVVPGIRERDRVLLWGGGIVDWTDAETVIRAVGLLTKRREDVKLFLLGCAVPPRTEAERRSLALASSLGLLGRAVFPSGGWVPYAERAAYLLDADLGVAAYFDTFEARLAYRARLLDYFWAGLPVVTTDGDTTGCLVRERNLGRTVRPGDVAAFAAAIEELLDDGVAYAEARWNATEICDELSWARAVEPLRRLIETSSPRSSGRPSAALRVEDLALRARLSLAQRGVAGAVAQAARRLRPGQPSSSES